MLEGGSRVLTQKFDRVIIAATFAFYMNGVWREACHGWIDVC